MNPDKQVVAALTIQCRLGLANLETACLSILGLEESLRNRAPWVRPSEWLLYTVDVKTAGTYRIDMHVACQGPGGTFRLEFEAWTAPDRSPFPTRAVGSISSPSRIRT